MISTIGRKNLRVRLLVSGIYLLLIVGSVTMVYPFLLMISGSTKSSMDLNELRIVPGFLTNDDTLYRKYLEGLFNEKMELFKLTYNVDDSSFQNATVPRQINNALVDDWDAYLKQANLSPYASMVGMMQMPVTHTVQPELLRALMGQLSDTYQGDIHQVNAALGTEYGSWSNFVIRPDSKILRREVPAPSALNARLETFYQTAPNVYRFYPSITGLYRSLFLKTQYTREIAEYNKTHQTQYQNYDQVHLTRTYPTDGTELQKKDWENFVRQTVNLLWLSADESARPIYTRFLKARYDSIDQLNKAYQTQYENYLQVPMSGLPYTTPSRMVDWQNMIEGWVHPVTGDRMIIPLESIRIDCVDFHFADYLLQKYGTLQEINSQLGTSYQNTAEIQIPQQQWHYRQFQKITGHLKWEFVIRNYVTVINYIVLHGRGVLNTVIYCLLAIISALIVNPMAAYAMSRYKMPSTYKVLLFLMLTMAFPPMVTQIPNFLMLRELGLLNTFAALILPSLANGYSIFLLKGFFDSLPKELYESAGLDGANEWVMFWQITMNLSKPILAVIALQAFNMAYANFMFALLTCQDDSMWTLMVWLYQLQTESTQGVVFASLMIAAVPTFFVFVFAQNIIMRGIVVPVEK
jgi:multiple sugar transport system permease protein